MIDLHCHLLPNVDDGARTIDDALALARALVDDGVTHAVVTPHIYAGRWDNTVSSLTPHFELLQAALVSHDIPLSIRLGAEVHMIPESLDLLDTSQVPFLGQVEGKNLMLLEMPDARIPVGAMQVVDFLKQRNVVPLIAHPERNKSIMRDYLKIEKFVKAGCLLQVTAGSICGFFGTAAKETAIQLLDQNWVFAVATDTHNLRYRPPVLTQARTVLQARYGDLVAKLLTETNPAAVIGLTASH